MDIKKIFHLLHSWEFPVLLNYLNKKNFFDYVGSGKTVIDLQKHFNFVESKFVAVLGVLISYGLILQNNDQIFLTDFSKKFLLSDSDTYIGSYITWRIEDLHHWEDNIDSVMRGEMKTVHGDSQYTQYTDSHKEALEGIVVACSRVYPVDEFAKKVSDKLTLTGSILDLGCGTGLWGLTIQKEFKDLSVIFFDREVDFVKDTVDRLGQPKPAVSIISGDMFQPGSLPKVDNVLVANVFMDWEDESVVRIIKKIVSECSPKTLIIHEFVNEDGVPYLADYNLLAHLETLGRTRNQVWWKEKLGVFFKNISFVKLDFGSTAIFCQNS